MARMKKLDRSELMVETEKLLLDHGYKGFHFKALAERLGVGRSTIYEYYSGKDELVTAYMLEVMGRIERECQSLHALASTKEKLKGLLALLMKYAQLHRITQIIPMIDRYGSPQVSQSIDQLFVEHERLFGFLRGIIQEGKAKGEIRSDVSDELIAQILFHSIQVHNGEQSVQDHAATQIFEVLFTGIQAKSQNS